MSNLFDLTRDQLENIGRATRRYYVVIQDSDGEFHLKVKSEDSPYLTPMNPGYYLRDAIVLASYAGLVLDFSTMKVESDSKPISASLESLDEDSIRKAICIVLEQKGKSYDRPI